MINFIQKRVSILFITCVNLELNTKNPNSSIFGINNQFINKAPLDKKVLLLTVPWKGGL